MFNQYYKTNFVRGELVVTSIDGKVTRMPLRLGNSITSTRRKLWLHVCAVRTIIEVSGNAKVIQEDMNIDDKLRWCWNEGIQIGFKYYE